MKNQLAGLMQQAQRMQDGMKRVQEELETIEVEGQAGSGMVKVTLNCKYRMRRIQIDPSLLGDDRDMLEDLIVAATNDAARLAEAAANQRMQSVTAGMPLPPGFKLPF
jgi:DNA-binding YbaB/EbfC family protein